MRRVLVTGGSGFIGSHVVDRLIASGIEPRIFDLRPSQYHAETVDTVLADLDDQVALTGAMRGCDAVIHLAAAADVGIVAEEPRDSEHCNAGGTLAVLEAARDVELERVVYGSTIWVYSEADHETVDEESPIGLPKHLYTASKLAGEMYCVSYRELYELPYTILRFGIPYGPRARPAAVIPIFVRKALAGEPLTIAGDGLQTRRFVYVEDLAEGVVRGLRPCARDRIYNLASTATVTIRDLADTVGEVIGNTAIVHTPGRNGDFGGAEISASRAADELGWEATTSLQEGVGRYVNWYTSGEREQVETVPAAPAVPAPRRAGAIAAALGRARRPLTLSLGVVCGTLMAYVLASLLNSFDEAQAHTVAVTTLVAIASLLLPLRWSDSRSATSSLTPFAWLFAGYVALLALPWSRRALELTMPSVWTLLLSWTVALGAFAVVFAVARQDDAVAPDQIS